MAEKEIKITISASAKSAKQAFEEVSAAAKKAADSIENTGRKGAKGIGDVDEAAKKAQDSIKGLSSTLKGLGAFGGAAAIGSLVKSIADLGLSAIKSASQMRQYEIAFQTMLKSASDGTRMLQDLQKFAAETPFDVPGVVEAAQQLLAFGFNAKEIIPTLRVLGDTAAGLGKSTAGVQQIAYALGQIRTSGTLKTQDMNQLTNAGISAWEILAQAAGKSVLEIKEMTEKGMIDSTKAVEVLTQGMTERFGGMMEQTAKEVRGLWSNITESVYNVQSTIGAFATDAVNLKGILQSVSEAVSSVGQSLVNSRNAGKSFGEALREAVPAPVLVALGTLAATLTGGVIVALGAAAVAAAGFVAATLPISGTVIAVSAAVGAAVSAIAMYWDECRAITQVAWNSIKGIVSGVVNSILGSVFKALEVASSFVSRLAKVSGFDTTEIDKFNKAVSEGSARAFAEAKAGFEQLSLKANTYADALREIQEAAKKAVSAPGETSGSAETGTGTVDLTNGKTKSTTKSAESIQRAIATARRESASLSKDLIQLQNDLLMAGLSGDAKVRQSIQNEKNARLASLQEILEKQNAAVEEALALQKKADETGNAEAIAAAKALYEEKYALLQESLAKEAELKKQIDLAATVELASQVTQVEEAWRNYANSIASGFGNAVNDMITGAKTAGQALKELLRNIITNAAQTAAQFLMLTGILSAFGVANAGNVAVQMMFGIDPGKIGSGGGLKSHNMSSYKNSYNPGGITYATGGYVAGAGTGTSDSIPAMLSNGEYVVKASAVRKIGVPTLNAINAGRGFADGGVVDAGAFASHPVTNNTKNENRTANISLNVSAMDAASFTDFLRNGGLDEIRQALFETDRNFGGMAGVW